MDKLDVQLQRGVVSWFEDSTSYLFFLLYIIVTPNDDEHDES